MKINKQQLQKAIETVRPGLASKEQIEQTTSFIFQEGKVITYNDEISLSHPVEDLEIEGAIQAEELYKLLGKLKKDEVDVSIEGNEVKLKAGRAKASFTLEQEITLPFKKEIGETGKWKKLPADFNRFAKFAMSACSRDMSDPVLTCTHITKTGYIEGTDRFRIARCFMGENMPIDTFLIPATSIREVLRIKPTHIAPGDGWVHFSNADGTILSSRIYKNKYKDISPFMEIEGVKVNFPASVIDSIDKASIFARRDNLLDEKVEISITKGKLWVKGRSDAGSFEEKSPIKYDGDPIGFIIAPYLLQDILAETPQCVVGENALKFEGEGWEYVSVLQNKEE
ncbi:MAG: hypothetical protein KGY70_18440 [Bacteroidales bacterium]|nr:hypothetical protein [Bacteroidales bacterium]